MNFLTCYPDGSHVQTIHGPEYRINEQCKSLLSSQPQVFPDGRMLIVDRNYSEAMVGGNVFCPV